MSYHNKYESTEEILRCATLQISYMRTYRTYVFEVDTHSSVNR